MILEWMRSYLSNRTQQVRFNNQWSKKIMTKYGVPQGSVQGPLLFTIYINDIMQICPEECNIKMFVDTILYVKGGRSEEIEKELNRVLLIVENCLNVNKLKMNASKTKFMIIRSIRKILRRNVILKYLDGTTIEQVESTKYLGVIIDNKLRVEEH